MENLKEEKIIDKKEKNDNKRKILSDEEEEKEEDENIHNNNIINEEDKEKEENEDEYSTDFTGAIELTEEEKSLRKKYLKKITKKEAIIRSITLGKRDYFSKLYSFLTSILYDILNIKETKYKSDAINAITAKNLEVFMTTMKYYFITI